MVALELSIRLEAQAPACASGEVSLVSTTETLSADLAFAGGVGTAIFPRVAVGAWTMGIRCGETVIPDYETRTATGSAPLVITPSTTKLIVDGRTGSVAWRYDYEYRLVSHDQLQAIVRLPVDPLDPTVEVVTLQSSWSYLYADRTFYDTGLDGSTAFVRGSGAFEIYDDLAHVLDKDRLGRAVADASGEVWNKADSLVLLAGAEGEELLLYHVWDLR